MVDAAEIAELAQMIHDDDVAMEAEAAAQLETIPSSVRDMPLHMGKGQGLWEIFVWSVKQYSTSMFQTTVHRLCSSCCFICGFEEGFKICDLSKRHMICCCCLTNLAKHDGRNVCMTCRTGKCNNCRNFMSY